MLTLLFVFALLPNPVNAADNLSPELTALTVKPQIVTDAEPVQFTATLLGNPQDLPASIIVVFRDVSDNKSFDQVLEVQLNRVTQTSSADTEITTILYQGSHAFPEAIKRTIAYSAASWYKVSTETYSLKTPISNIANAWFFVPIKVAADGHETTATGLAYTPVTGYSLRKNDIIKALTAVYATPQSNGTVALTAYGQNMSSNELNFIWANGQDKQQVNLERTGEDKWQTIFRPHSPLAGRYRLTRIEDATNGERFLNYPDTYFSLISPRSKAPEVNILTLSITQLPYRLRAYTTLSGDLAGINRLAFSWTFTNDKGQTIGSALTDATQQGNGFTSTFAPTNTVGGSWSITGLRIYYSEGWQLNIDDPDILEDFNAAMSVSTVKRDVDVPILHSVNSIADGEILRFVFPEEATLWLPGEVSLEYEQRSEAWVIEPSTRSLIVYHPFHERGYYIRLWLPGATEAILLYASRV